ncbi:MAG: methyltransferase domain-containing protein [Dysgonomonas sp.]|nr:methyltransferase domain-containing protein [Dysgonomonas sp.]
MTEYLSYSFNDSEEFINTYDEMPLWSASFGLLLLKYLELRPNITVLDIGSGTGFPLLELAERMGKSCKLYGVDVWKNANERAKQKIQDYGITNVEIIESSAEKLPFENDSVDLIVSNLGINNFDNPEKVFGECSRVLKSKGKLAITTNLNGHWRVFYNVFEAAIRQLGKDDIFEAVVSQQEDRGTVESVSEMFTNNGFRVTRHFEDKFEMKFVDGSSFLNHHFVKLGWLSSWVSLIPENELAEVFTVIEQNLNSYSRISNGLTLGVPMLYIEGEKI